MSEITNEDISQRHIADQELADVFMAEHDGKVPWEEEDTPESHLIHCIYRELEKEGYAMHHPICGIKLEANLYDKYEE